jgi:voltage-gated potassium channel
VKRLLVRLVGTVPGIRWLVAGLAAVAILCALVARIAAPEDFPTYGRAFWWSVQTVTTVGYGDVTPQSTTGRAIAAVLMVCAIALISVLTASISASFINRLEKSRGEDPLFAALQRIEARLAALEQEREAEPKAAEAGSGEA